MLRRVGVVRQRLGRPQRSLPPASACAGSAGVCRPTQFPPLLPRPWPQHFRLGGRLRLRCGGAFNSLRRWPLLEAACLAWSFACSSASHIRQPRLRNVAASSSVIVPAATAFFSLRQYSRRSTRNDHGQHDQHDEDVEQRAVVRLRDGELQVAVHGLKDEVAAVAAAGRARPRAVLVGIDRVARAGIGA